MAKTILINIASVVASLMIAIVMLALIEGISAILHPWPADFGGTAEEVRAHVARYPTWVLALLGGFGWGATALAACWVATKIAAAHIKIFGYAIGAVLLAVAIFNMSMLPYPLWLWPTVLILRPAGAHLGVSLASER